MSKAEVETLAAAVTAVFHGAAFGHTRLLVGVEPLKVLGSAAAHQCVVSSAFVDMGAAHMVASIDEAVVFARAAEAARLGGAKPREAAVG